MELSDGRTGTKCLLQLFFSLAAHHNLCVESFENAHAWGLSPGLSFIDWSWVLGIGIELKLQVILMRAPAPDTV